MRVDDDAAEERLVLREEGADEAYTDVTDDDGPHTILQENVRSAIGDFVPSSPPQNSTSNLWATAVENLHAPANSPRAPLDLVIGDPDYFPKSSDSDGCPSLIQGPDEDAQNASMTHLREVQQRDFGEPFLTLSPEENAAMAAMVAPATGKLVKLKEFTPDKMPAYHPDVRNKSYAQVLKSRLEAIARSIEFGRKISEEGRLQNELKMCRYIATEYWPLPLAPTTHLDIHRMYRNALFRETSAQQLRQDHTNHQLWAQEVVETKRPSMSFGEAASRFAGAQQAQQDIIDAAEAEHKARRLRQEEEDRKEAERLDRWLNQPDPGLGGSGYTSSYNRNEAAELAAQTLLKDVGQDANAGTYVQVGRDQYGQPIFKNDEEYARWLHLQDNSGYDDGMPGLVYDIHHEREEQLAKDHAYAIQLDKEDREAPSMGLGRTRSETAKATQNISEDARIQEYAVEEKAKQVVTGDSPLTPFSRYSLLGPSMATSRYEDEDGRVVAESEDDAHTALIADSPPMSPATRYGQKRKDRESEGEPSEY